MNRSLVVLGIIAFFGAVYFVYFRKSPPPVTATTAPVVHKRLAPSGIFYLTQRVSVTTDSGITGHAPGTEVRFIRGEGNSIRVRAGGDEFLVQQAQITNDLDIVARIRKADSSTQAQIQRSIAASVNAAKARSHDRAELARQEARLSYLKLDETKLKNAVNESPKRSHLDAHTLRKYQSIQNEITRTEHLIDELRLKIRADDQARQAELQ